MTAPGPALQIANLELTLVTGPTPVPLVRDVSLTIPPGGALGVVGESGCGKSLTCLAILDLLPPGIRATRGTIRVGGEAIDAVTPSARQALRGRAAALILQHPMSAFDSVFSIRHHFRETLAAHGMTGARQGTDLTEDALADVGFPHPRAILDLYPFQMSGGMLQRVMIALALVLAPPLLIADEPTTDLDVVAQAQVLDLLARLRQQRGMAMLLVSHDLSVVARLADEVSVMHQGRILETGPVGRIFDDARHAYSRTLVDAHLELYRRYLAVLGAGAAPPTP
jgi:nickel transport system ATP-binding protein